LKSNEITNVDPLKKAGCTIGDLKCGGSPSISIKQYCSAYDEILRDNTKFSIDEVALLVCILSQKNEKRIIDIKNVNSECIDVFRLYVRNNENAKELSKKIICKDVQKAFDAIWKKARPKQETVS
jgi:hypothetical protein